jgi:hypothetical protein
LGKLQHQVRFGVTLTGKTPASSAFLRCEHALLFGIERERPLNDAHPASFAFPFATTRKFNAEREQNILQWSPALDFECNAHRAQPNADRVAHSFTGWEAMMRSS